MTHTLINKILRPPHLNIILIGSGNVATQLGIAFKNAQCNIIQVYSKQKSTSSKLAKLLKCKSTNNIKSINLSADIYIIAINDDAIKDVAKQLKLKDKIIAHTSGSIDMIALKSTSSNIGIFYPLQTISKSKTIDFSKTPVCIEANNNTTLAILNSLAKKISNNIYVLSSNQRKQIHLAAVFACNFTNHLYIIAEKILQKNKLPLSILYPLIEETAIQIQKQSPTLLQTGPAKRGDKKVMQQHLQQLGVDKELKQLYQLISKQIAENTSK